MGGRATVGIVVVDFNGRDLSLRCLEGLDASTWPRHDRRIVLVDNGSDQPIAADVRVRWPDVEVVATARNLGFGGGCNRGIERLDDVEFVALLNNDAVPDPGWLEPLVAALRSDAGLAAATPKVLLSGSWYEIEIRADAVRVERDPRLLGVQVGRVWLDGHDVTAESEWAAGFWGAETSHTGLASYQWTSREARLLVPATSDGTITLELAVPGGSRSVELGCHGEVVRLDVGTATHVELHPSTGPCEVVNNAGAVVLRDGSLTDRGFLEVDCGQYDQPADVDAWSGTAVLLRRDYLRDVGLFDESLFLYYEDSDLSWRGRNRGWRYRYVPDSVVRHDRSATTRHLGGMVGHLSARNRLLVVTKSAPWSVAASAWVAMVRDVLRTARVDVVGRALRGRRPLLRHLAGLLRVDGAATRRAPGAVLFRVLEPRRARRNGRRFRRFGVSGG